MQATLATPAASEFLPLIPELVLVGAAFALLIRPADEQQPARERGGAAQPVAGFQQAHRSAGFRSSDGGGYARAAAADHHDVIGRFSHGDQPWLRGNWIADKWKACARRGRGRNARMGVSTDTLPD